MITKLRACIAALEADNAVLLKRLGARTTPEIASCVCHLAAPGRCNNCEDRELCVRPHPGAALLAEHAKEVERFKEEVRLHDLERDEAASLYGHEKRRAADLDTVATEALAAKRSTEYRLVALEVEHAKALVRARNEALEKAAAWAEALGAQGSNPSAFAVAASIRSMKEAEQ